MNFPQILLLGNGLNRSFDGVSWKDLLKKIKKREDLEIDNLTSPMPLQAILVTNDDIKGALKDAMKGAEKDVVRNDGNKNDYNLFWGKVKDDCHMGYLHDLLSIDFDDILTTNYSYELEAASQNTSTISCYNLDKMKAKTDGNWEQKYFLHRYNKVSYQGKNHRVWHIHGESRFPNSLTLGHYWYGNLFNKIHNELSNRRNDFLLCQKNGTKIEYNSWVDSFVMGDIYVFGFGYDMSEIDLWWLLNRKKNEKAEHGEIFFYEMKDKSKKEKFALLNLFGVKPVDLGMTVPAENCPLFTEKYKEFYSLAIKDIRERVRNKKNITST